MSGVVLVTGGTRGIGLAAVEALHRQGFDVVASGRSTPADIGGQLPTGVAYEQLDVTDQASIAAAVANVQERFGRIDVLVNNAGSGTLGALESVTPDDLRAQFEVNVIGVHAVSRAVLPIMRAQGRGRLVMIGSSGGTFTVPGAGAYFMTKWAIESYADALRFEVAPFGIDVVLLQPTGVRTGFADEALGTLPDEAGPYDGFHRTLALRTDNWLEGRGTGLIEPDDVAAAVVRACTATRPHTRYPVGWSARAATAVRRLTPDRVWDGLLRIALRPVGSSEPRVGRSAAESA